MRLSVVYVRECWEEGVRGMCAVFECSVHVCACGSERSRARLYHQRLYEHLSLLRMKI